MPVLTLIELNMGRKNSYLTVTDQFCGAGGSSQGVRRLSRKMGGGFEVKLAMNHWRLAIETHNTNFPETEHDCADIQAVDPRRYQSTDILITSPECTNHSLAKGVKRKYQQTNTLFGDLTIDSAAERSRATMWDVPRFAEIHNYNLIIVENVVEARLWVMWDAWLHAMHNLGYNHKCVYLNSMHTLPTPQSRDRMYIIFWKKGNKTPDLNFCPKAYCSCCGKEVESIQSWKNPRKKFGKYRQQYIYRCPRCMNEVEPYYYSAFNVIDWSKPGERIGNRKNPLKPNTMKRIQYGIDRCKDSSFVIYTDNASVLNRASGINDPMYTQTTRQVAALVTKGSYGGDVVPVSFPEYTMTTQHNFGVSCVPIVIKNYGGGFNPKHSPIPLDKVLGTMTTVDSHGILGVPFLVENRGQSNVRSINQALSTQTSIVTHGLISTEAVNAFLAYYYGNNQVSGMFSPIGTIPTKDRVALVLSSPGNIDINDCTYRMLFPHEVQAAMAFDSDYIVCGNGKEKVKQLGNAVTPPVMEALLARGVETFY